MAGEGEELLVATAAAEPDECSRWAMIGLLGCVGMLLVCIFFFFMLINYRDVASLRYPVLVFLLAFLLLLLGLFFCSISIIMIQERCSGNPVEERFLVDILLLL